MSEQYVVIRDMSDSHSGTGDAWQETKIFGPDTTLHEVMEWAVGETHRYGDTQVKLPDRSRKRVTLTLADRGGRQ